MTKPKTTRPRALVIVFIATWGLLAHHGACAQTTEVTCYSDVFAPYVVQEGTTVSGVNGSGTVTGIDTDAIAEAGKRVGVKVTFKILPWVRLEKEIEKGADSAVDCAFAYTLTDARKAYMVFTTAPIKQSVLSIYARKDSFANYKGLADVKGKTLGIRRGFKLPPDLQAMVDKHEVTIEEVNQDDQNFQKLSKGRLDGVLSNQDVAATALKQPGMDGIVALNPAILSIATFMVFNKAKKNLAPLAPLFDKGIAEINADGTYKKIRGKYL